MKKTLEQRVSDLENIFFGTVDQKGPVTWKQVAQSPTWKRSIKGTPESNFDEENVTIYYDRYGRLSMDFGGRCTLYAKYLPIYRDAIERLERIADEHGIEMKAKKDL